MHQICLVMIVKNESLIIERCLQSISPFISSWSISDTGSTDGTQEIIKTFFKKEGIKGHLWEDKWENFGKNRTLAFENAKKVTTEGYYIVMDADSLFSGKLEVPLEKNNDSFYIPIRNGDIFHRRQLLFNAKLPWEYKGVLHEYPYCSQANSLVGNITEGIILDSTTGKRNEDPEKYSKDASLLLKVMEQSPTPRDCFYLAQSYRDAGNKQEAIRWYQRRTGMEGWDEEIYVSFLNIGRLVENKWEKLSFFKQAFKTKNRLEALTEIMKIHRQDNDLEKSWLEGLQGIFIELDDGSLFTEMPIYDYQFLDELSIAAFSAGQKNFCRLLFEKMKNIPPCQLSRINDNKKVFFQF